MFKKLVLSLLASLVLFTSSLGILAQTAHAQWYRQEFQTFVATVEGDGNDLELYAERYTLAQVHWIVYSLLYMLIPDQILCFLENLPSEADPVPNIPGLTGCLAGLGTLLGDSGVTNTESSPYTGTNFASSMFNSPISSTTYFKTIGQRLHLVPEAQAQGFGFEAGSLVFGLWEASRNVAYSLLIIVIIVMAFMIMFRVKLSPQTVITVQSALPKVIITLILITFSYAIAGLMIDLMYVAIGLLTTILDSANIVADTITWGDLYAQLTWNNGAFELMLKYWIMFIGALFMALTSNALGLISLLFAGTPILTVVIGLVMIIVVFIIGFRIWWMLLRNFVMILFSIVLGPFQILFGALSPRGGFGPWARNLAGLLAVYPVIGFMFVLSFVFLRAAWEGTLLRNIFAAIPGDIISNVWPFDVAGGVLGDNAWAPPLTGTPNDLDLVWLGASLAILALIPRASDMVREAMAGRAFGFGTAIGEGLAFGSGAAMGAWGMARGGATGMIGERLGGLGATLQQSDRAFVRAAGRAAVRQGQQMAGFDIVRRKEDDSYAGQRRRGDVTDTVTARGRGGGNNNA